jgi:FixJ family two-component response regulator
MTPAGAPTVLMMTMCVRPSIQSMLKSAALRPETFETAQEFLRTEPPDGQVLVLDVSLPGVSGLGFQHDLADAGVQIPIIFITGYEDILMTVKAMKSGAVEFLTKPFRTMQSELDEL